VMPGGTGYPGGLPQITADGTAVVFCLRDNGYTHLYALDLASGEFKPLVAEDGVLVSGLSVAARSSLAAVIVTDTKSFGEIAVVDPAKPGHRVLTRHTEAALPDVEPLVAQPREFTIAD